jgi:hypothetical protein
LKNLIAFTLVSNNHLVYAKTLHDSFKKFHPDFLFYTGLIDEYHPDINYNDLIFLNIISYKDINCDFFEEMINNYSIAEFSWSLKPFFSEYLLNKFGRESKLVYLDSDLFFCGRIDAVLDKLDVFNMVLTPHLTQPTDFFSIEEQTALIHGIYNMGFFGIKYSAESFKFLKWWKIRLRTHCITDKLNGLTGDQKWMNLSNLFFKDIHVLMHQGYNVAFWNINERMLIKQDNKFFINSLSQELIFFHFSGFDPFDENYFGKLKFEKYSYKNRIDIIEISNIFKAAILTNGYNDLKNLIPINKYADKNKILENNNFKHISFKLKIKNYLVSKIKNLL